jgi:hypothetical protein
LAESVKAFRDCFRDPIVDLLPLLDQPLNVTVYDVQLFPQI